MDRNNLALVLSDLAETAKSRGLPPSSVQMISITANTPVSMNKGGRGGNAGGFLNRVTIRHNVNGVIGTYWQNIVNRLLSKEGGKETITLHPRKWGTRIEGQPLVEHTTKEGEYRLYLEFFPLKRSNAEYLVDGRQATPKEVEEFTPYLVEKAKDSKVTLSNGEVKRIAPILRDYLLTHIEEVRIMGDIISVEDNGELVIHHKDGTTEKVGVIS